MQMKSPLSDYSICEINVSLFNRHYAATGCCICIGRFIFKYNSPSYCSQYFTVCPLTATQGVDTVVGQYLQVLLPLCASGYVFQILIGILIATRIKAVMDNWKWQTEQKASNTEWTDLVPCFASTSVGLLIADIFST